MQIKRQNSLSINGQFGEIEHNQFSVPGRDRIESASELNICSPFINSPSVGNLKQNRSLPKGRGASIQPANPYLEVREEPDLEQVAEDSAYLNHRQRFISLTNRCRL